ncbi:Thionin [Thalictrum thalictroides]|uniref:Thionin n=1 Tax=Thalictrum thalictroides TaxID=46969 RepID=A0A7J6UU61_THATH|nr:Thionin [Thalictrum thalictroides]
MGVLCTHNELVDAKKTCFEVVQLEICGGRPVCAKTCGCQNVDGKCPPGYEKDILENTGAINEYCKLGCASFVCSAIGTLQTSGEEVVNEAVEQCYNACSAFCTKGSTSAVETA